MAAFEFLGTTDLWLDPFSESFVPIWGTTANIESLHHSPQKKVLVKPELN